LFIKILAEQILSMVVNTQLNTPANAVESGILELASHLHNWYITVEATAANVVGMIGSDHQVLNASQRDVLGVNGLHVDDIAKPPPPDQTTMVENSFRDVGKGNRSILKTKSSHRSHFQARHVRWDSPADGRPNHASCYKPMSKP
jgi:hypothetical protein